MYVYNFISITLVLLICVGSEPSGLYINVPEKIAFEANSTVVSNRIVYLPLGWPAIVPCSAAAALREANLEPGDLMEWTIRANSTDQQNVSITDPDFMISEDSLHILSVSRWYEDVVLECRVARPDHPTLISRLRIRIQDCSPNGIKEQSTIALRDPCAYGKCQLKENDAAVQCICFRQYTGAVCDRRKDYSWLQDLLPFVVPILAAIVFIIIFCGCADCCDGDDTSEQLMGCAEVIGFADRSNFSLPYLYPMLSHLKKCNYECPPSNEEGVERRRTPRKKEKKDRDEMQGSGTEGSGFFENFAGEMWNPERRRRRFRRPKRRSTTRTSDSGTGG